MKSEKMQAALKWWDNLDNVRFDMLKKYGYQDSKKTWKYRPLTDKGILIMYCAENELSND